MYFSYVHKQLRDILEEVLSSDDGIAFRKFALTVAHVIFPDLFDRWALTILFQSSLEGRLAEERHVAFQQFCTDTINRLGLAFDSDTATTVSACLTIAINGHTDANRSWGVELLAKQSKELAISIGEWLILENGAVVDSESKEMLRAICYIKSPKSIKIIHAAFRSTLPMAIGLAIMCVDEKNFSPELSDLMLDAKARLPGGYSYIGDRIGNLINTQGRSSDDASKNNTVTVSFDPAQTLPSEDDVERAFRPNGQLKRDDSWSDRS